jgi:hypothetical protein
MLISNGLSAQKEVSDMNSNDVTELVAENLPYWVGQYDNGIAKISKGGKWGLLNTQGNVICSIQFDEIFDFDENGLAKVSSNGLFGLIDQGGTILHSPTFSQLRKFNDGVAIFKSDNDKFGIVNGKGEVVTSAKYDYLSEFTNGRASFRIEQSFGFVNTDGTSKTVLKSSYNVYLENFQWHIGRKGRSTQLLKFDEELAINFKSIKGIIKYGFINPECKFLVKPKYDWVLPFKYGLAPVMVNDKWGAINLRGKSIVPIKFDSIIAADSLFIVCENKKWGVINKQGTVRIPIKYDAIQHLKGELFSAFDSGSKLHSKSLYSQFEDQAKGAWGVVNSDHQTIVPFDYEKITMQYDFGSAQFLSEIDGGRRAVSETVETYLMTLFNVSGPISSTLYMYQMEVSNLIDFDILIESTDLPKFGVRPIHRADSKFVFIDRNGHQIIDEVYDYAEPFANEVAIVGIFNPNQLSKEKHSLKGLINNNGEIIVPLQYENLINEYSNFYPIQYHGKWGVINNQNEFVIEPNYNDIRLIKGGLITQMNTGLNGENPLCGFIDLTGNMTVPPVYSQMQEASNGLLKVTLNEESFFINKIGKRIKIKN